MIMDVISVNSTGYKINFTGCKDTNLKQKYSKYYLGNDWHENKSLIYSDGHFVRGILNRMRNKRKLSRYIIDKMADTPVWTDDFCLTLSWNNIRSFGTIDNYAPQKNQVIN